MSNLPFGSSSIEQSRDASVENWFAALSTSVLDELEPTLETDGLAFVVRRP
jgi:hypothetical protein|tara:strand:- start:232 stop:384 length:153 start_codon:yes stop_codon:yes gene_type:complete